MRVFKECDDPAVWADPAAGEWVLSAPDGALCQFGNAELVALARQAMVEGAEIEPNAFWGLAELAGRYGAGLFAASEPRHRP